MNLIAEYLPSILAGLFPSLMALIPVIVTSIKNIKVNKNLDDLAEMVQNLKEGNITIGQALDQTIKQVDEVKSNVIKEFNEVHNEARVALTKDVGELQLTVNSKLSEFELMTHEILLALTQNVERMKNYDNVPTLPKEGQEEVHPSED